MIIGVTDESPMLVDSFVAKYKPTYPIVITKNRELEQHLEVKGFPTAAVIEPKGKVSWLGHFGYDSALKKAKKGSKRTAMWPKALSKAEGFYDERAMAESYHELRAVLDDGKLDEADATFAAEAREWLESSAARTFRKVNEHFDEGDVFGAMTMVQHYVDGKTPFDGHQEMMERIESTKRLKTFRDEMKAGEMLVEARILVRSRSTLEDGCEILEKVAKKYDDTQAAGLALDLLDELEKHRD